MKTDRLVTVRPVPGGWCVTCGLIGDLMFFSGARAEEHAHNLARGLADAGSDVRVDVHDRRDQLIATRRYFGDADVRSPAAASPQWMVAHARLLTVSPGDAASSQ